MSGLIETFDLPHMHTYIAGAQHPLLKATFPENSGTNDKLMQEEEW